MTANFPENETLLITTFMAHFAKNCGTRRFDLGVAEHVAGADDHGSAPGRTRGRGSQHCVGTRCGRRIDDPRRQQRGELVPQFPSQSSTHPFDHQR
jgi:hypothetical protein